MEIRNCESSNVERDHRAEAGGWFPKFRMTIACSNKKNGGRRIRSHALTNKALLGKWGWRYAIENNRTLKEIIG